MSPENREHAPVVVDRLGMTRGAMYAVLVLAFACVCLALWNVTLYQSNRDLKSRVKAQETARATEKRATNASQVIQCFGSIPSIKVANTVVGVVKSNLIEQAVAAETLAKLDPVGSKERKARLATAHQRRVSARVLKPFPPRTSATCTALAKKLHVNPTRLGIKAE